MKNLIKNIALIIAIIFIFKLSWREWERVNENKKQHCFGYTKIEYNKAINCNGDTVYVKPIGESIHEAMGKIK